VVIESTTATASTSKRTPATLARGAVYSHRGARGRGRGAGLPPSAARRRCCTAGQPEAAGSIPELPVFLKQPDGGPDVTDIYHGMPASTAGCAPEHCGLMCQTARVINSVEGVAEVNDLRYPRP
jgi:hypothetical protein